MPPRGFGEAVFAVEALRGGVARTHFQKQAAGVLRGTVGEPAAQQGVGETAPAGGGGGGDEVQLGFAGHSLPDDEGGGGVFRFVFRQKHGAEAGG